MTALATGLDEADAFELDRRLRLAVRLEQTLDAAIAPLLRVVTSAEHEWSGDYQTLAAYTREQLGMSVGKARALLLRAGHHFAWQRCKFHPEKAQDPIPPSERQLCARDVDCEAIQQLEWRVPREVVWRFHATRETLRARLRTPSGRPLLDGEAFDALRSTARSSPGPSATRVRDAPTL